ncbi:chemotaxis protein [Terribacillus saccharophilus]|uniref:Chemotaxis protein n=1 Tax=Terribacillus saccharophilus TaxID=361277 RepID=A0A268H923_9BACI|nr:methyl-accepting chemotaxis protein [Terribacillus saccharophilus]PAD35756.1 chemotaxis protein [Terribacillus saccharophilus]PAD96373.1 chemotaxis protein [Terribacillus saccharophilus]PAD99948.1 chemotaxis protein [Terribacillus saccharophilus]PAE06387.1 chemotaxis protein [Terribacillus saccharophilus]
MEFYLIGIIVILLIALGYFAYQYVALKRRAQFNTSGSGDEIILNSAGNEQRLENFSHIEKKLLSLSKDVNEKGINLAETGEYASEQADIVRAAIDEVGRGLEKQLVATEESAASMEEMTQAIENLSVRSNQISEQSNTTLDLTQQGNEKLKDSLVKMDQFNQTVNTTSNAINKLGEKSYEISSIVKVITEISEQINLLALNAAIEAARAGENGKGFAVVADEVRKLAEQTRQSTSEVSHIVKNIQEETAIVVKSMNQGTEEFKDTNADILEVGNMFEKILSTTKIIAENNENSSANTEELSTASHQIMTTIVEIASISRESVEMFEELIEINDEELHTIQNLVEKARNLIDHKNVVGELLKENDDVKAEEVKAS